MEQLAPHVSVFVAKEFLEDENHGSIPCHECHGGDPGAEDALAAHNGLVRDPSRTDAEAVCGQCHPDVAEAAATSLHVTLAPFKALIDARAGDGPQRACVDAARAAHCGACHGSCGQCHVSRPSTAGGGLLDGHLFQKTPPSREVCTACHGSRVENEYYGRNKGLPPDVHWRKRFMGCMDCHSGEEMHGQGGEKPAMHRYEVADAPRCEACHEDIYADGASNLGQHKTHRGRVSCQVCHSTSYKNCSSCHFALDKYGFRYFQTQEATMDFKIGLSPMVSKQRPERFVTLRHVPVAPDTFRYYARDGLPAFDAVNTWKLCTPHNIQRKTPQNQSCNACHGNEKLFLRPDDVAGAESWANARVVVGPDLMPEEWNADNTAAAGAPPGNTGE